MCRLCSNLKDLIREERNHFDRLKKRYHRWYREDVMLFRECLIALDWKKYPDLCDRLAKQIYLEDENE